MHPESPAEVLRAFSRAGIVLPDDPGLGAARRRPSGGAAAAGVQGALPDLDGARLGVARRSGCATAGSSPEYVPGGVVSGRWATRGGGALQIPKVVRRAVVADPGWTFVVADAGQLEPRVLAAVSGDAGLAAAAGAGDLYAALAADAFGGDRAKAKVALLGAMYGQTGGAAVPALAVLQARFPTAWEYVRGGRPHRRGRRAGPLLAGPHLPAVAGVASRDVGGEQARARGRFTRNFVIQATAAEWALALLAALRAALAGTRRRAGVLPARRGGRALPGGGRPTRWSAAVRAAGEQARPAAVRRHAGAVPARRVAWCAATPTRPDRPLADGRATAK